MSDLCHQPDENLDGGVGSGTRVCRHCGCVYLAVYDRLGVRTKYGPKPCTVRTAEADRPKILA